MTSHETPLLLSHGLRRSGVKPTGVQEPPRGAKISTLSFNLRQVAKAAHEGTCSIILTGMEWTGQVLAQEVIANVDLDARIAAGILTRWQNMCSWYQIVGGSAALSSLQVKLAEQKERHTELLRKAPTAVVKKDISKTETYIKRINEGITFCEVGYVCRRADISVDGGRPMDADLTLRDNGCHATEHEIEFRPSRIGMGPCVHLRVTCATRKGKMVDSFQAVVPCKHEGHEAPDSDMRAHGFPGEMYSCMTAGDMARIMQRIYFARNKGWQEASLPTIKYYGKVLGANVKGDEIFKYYRGQGALYQDKLTLLLDLAPYVEVLTPEEEAAKAAMGMVLLGVLQGILM